MAEDFETKAAEVLKTIARLIVLLFLGALAIGAVVFILFVFVWVIGILFLLI